MTKSDGMFSIERNNLKLAKSGILELVIIMCCIMFLSVHKYSSQASPYPLLCLYSLYTLYTCCFKSCRIKINRTEKVVINNINIVRTTSLVPSTQSQSVGVKTALSLV